jgi:hypothetical protein
MMGVPRRPVEGNTVDVVTTIEAAKDMVDPCGLKETEK